MDKIDLKQFLREVVRQTISAEDIKWWTDSNENQNFNSAEEAREAVFQQKEHARKQGWGGSTKENRKFADNFPVYQMGKKFKIGIKTTKLGFDWKMVQIKPNTTQEFAAEGLLDIMSGESLGKTRLVSTNSLIPSEQHSQTAEGQNKIKMIANSLKQKDAFFVPVVIESSGTIVDGHHRYYAIKLLGIKNIPAQIVLGRD